MLESFEAEANAVVRCGQSSGFSPSALVDNGVGGGFSSAPPGALPSFTEDDNTSVVETAFQGFSKPPAGVHTPAPPVAALPPPSLKPARGQESVQPGSSSQPQQVPTSDKPMPRRPGAANSATSSSSTPVGGGLQPEPSPPSGGGATHAVGKRSTDEPTTKAPMSKALEQAIEDMKAKLEATKEKLAASRSKTAQLEDQLGAKERQLDEIRRAGERAEQERLRMAAAAEEAERKMKQRREAGTTKERRRARVADLDSELDGSGASVNDDDELEFESDFAKEQHLKGLQLFWWRLRRQRLRLHKRLDRWIDAHWLLRRDVRRIESHFGSSVSVYFLYTEFLFNLAFGNALIWATLQSLAAVQQVAGAGPDTKSLRSGVMSYLPPRSLLYSAYGGQPAGEFSHVSVAYGLTALAYMLWYVLSTLWRSSREYQQRTEREVYEDAGAYLFASQVFTSWDVSTDNQASLHQAKHMALSNLKALLYEREWRQRVAQRSDRDRFWLVVRQACVLSLHALLQGSMWTLIVYVQVYSTTIDQRVLSATGSTLASSLASVVLYTILIEVMPLLVPYLSNAARWDNPKYTRNHLIFGFYGARAIGLLVLGASEAGMILMWTENVQITGAGTANFQGSLLNRDVPSNRVTTRMMYNMARPPDPALFVCGQDQLGNKFLQQALVGFLSPKAAELAQALAMWLYTTKIRGSEWTRMAFRMEAKFIRNVYFQGILWIAVPYLPLMAFLMPIVLMLEFKFDKIYLLRACSKSTTPFQANFSTMLFFHGLTLLLFVMFWTFLFVHEQYPTNLCGPFFDPTATPSSASAITRVDVLNYLYTRLQPSADGYASHAITYIFNNAILLWLIIISYMYKYTDQRNRANMLEQYKEERATIEAGEKARQATKVAQLEADAKRLRNRVHKLVEERGHAND